MAEFKVDQRPEVQSIEDAKFWIGVMHHRTCQDADHYVELLNRLAATDAAILQLRRIIAVIVGVLVPVLAVLVTR